MASLLFLVLFLAMASGSDATWCVCKTGLSDQVLQKTLDYACGAGADCNPIHQNGPCYGPNTVLSHCSYATNSYFQKKGQAQGTCDFSGTAGISTTDPSYTGCSYPASASTAGTTPSTSTTPSTTNPGTTTPTTFNPNNPTTGVIGGMTPGLGPAGTAINNNDFNGGFLTKTNLGFLFSIVWFSGMALLKG